MGLNGALGLGFVFSARETVSAVTEHLHKGLEGLKHAGEETSKSLTNAFGIGTKAIAGATVAIAAATAGLAFEASEHAEKFSSAIRQAGVASRATADELEGLERVAMRHGIDTLRGSAVGAAEALRELALEGYGAAEATDALDSTLLLMKITAMDAKGAAGLVHDSLQLFGMQAGQSADLVDSLAYSMKAFGFRSEELGPAMSGLASGAALTHSSLHDVLIAVGLVHSTFPSATKSAQAMNLALAQLANPKAQSELRGIGVAVTDAHGKILPLIDILGSLSKHTAGLSDAALAHRLETIAGGRAAGGLSAVIEGLRKGVKGANGEILTGSAAIDFLRNQMDHTSGSAKAMAAILGDDMGGAMTALKNAISNAMVAIGSGFEGPFKRAFQAANLFIRGLTQLFTQGGFTGEVREALDKNLPIKGFVEGVFIWVERLRHMFADMGASLQATFAPFRPMLTSLANTVSALGQALGITGQTVGDNVSAWDALGTIGSGLGVIFADLASGVLPLLEGAIGLVGAAVVVLRDAWRGVVLTLGGVSQAFDGLFGALSGALSGSWKGLWDGFVDVVVGAAHAIVQLVLGALAVVSRLIDGVGASFGQNFGLTDAMKGLQDEVASRVTGGTAVLKSVVSGPEASPVVAASANLQARSGSAPIIVHAPPPGEQTVNVTVHSVLDGEKVGEGVARAKRSSDGRAFHAVPAYDGAF